MRILGIDPGTRKIGYGVIEIDRGNTIVLEFGTVHIAEKITFPQKLKKAYQNVSDLIDRFQPDEVAVEEVFVSQNAKTTLRLGHVRGVILLAAEEKKSTIAEYAPREIKQAITGRGATTKNQLGLMVSSLLKIPVNTVEEDAADALAVALCHGFRSGMKKYSVQVKR